MKKNKMILFFLFISYTLGCSSTSKQQSISPTNPETFEKISIGASKNDVLKQLGKASEQRTEGQFEHWIYSNNDTDNTQVGSISFDSSSQQVIGVTIIPPLDSNIGQINFLKNKKFVNTIFIELPLQRCHRDYTPVATYFINKEKGIIIRYDRRTKYVDNFSIATTAFAEKIEAEIKKCLR